MVEAIATLILEITFVVCLSYIAVSSLKTAERLSERNRHLVEKVNEKINRIEDLKDELRRKNNEN